MAPDTTRINLILNISHRGTEFTEDTGGARNQNVARYPLLNLMIIKIKQERSDNLSKRCPVLLCLRAMSFIV